MSKPYQNLPEALRGVIFEMGKEVVEDVKLVNILADVCYMEDIPATGNILKKILADGFGAEILAITTNPSWEIKLKMLTLKLTSQNGFKDDITEYIIDSFAYGLGLSEKMPRSVIAPRSSSNTISDLEIELKKLKGEYITFLEENVLTADGLPPSYSTNDKSDIYEYREKILMLSDALGKNDLSWCDDRMKEVMAKYTPEPKNTGKKGFFKRLFGS